MKLIFYNTLTRRKEIFKPLHKKKVGLYTCGPTVYDYAHIGNFRTYIFQDILKRTLRHAGFEVRHIMNITDVDDKTIRGALAAHTTLKLFTRVYEKIFKQDLKKLEIEPPTRFVRATEHIPDIIKLISLLVKKKFAYEKEGSVYFDISRFKRYGKLGHLDLGGLKTSAKTELGDEYSKDEIRDFALWKAAKENEVGWKSPFGYGRPGWHIECSAMSMRYLGPSFDMHTAAVDLIFPHHENEIAQSEAATGKKFVRFWLHGEHLLVDGKKMSKSLGNFFTLRDIEEKKIDPISFRYLMLTAHYRSKLNFTWEALYGAEKALEGLYAFVRELKGERMPKSRIKNQESAQKMERLTQEFENAMLRDLDTPNAVAVLWKVIREYHKKSSEYGVHETLNLLFYFDKILGIRLEKVRSVSVPSEIKKLVREREEFRKQKKFPDADRIREEIEKSGWRVEDQSDDELPIIRKGK